MPETKKASDIAVGDNIRVHHTYAIIRVVRPTFTREDVRARLDEIAAALDDDIDRAHALSRYLDDMLWEVIQRDRGHTIFLGTGNGRSWVAPDHELPVRR